MVTQEYFGHVTGWRSPRDFTNKVTLFIYIKVITDYSIILINNFSTDFDSTLYKFLIELNV